MGQNINFSKKKIFFKFFFKYFDRKSEPWDLSIKDEKKSSNTFLAQCLLPYTDVSGYFYNIQNTTN